MANPGNLIKRINKNLERMRKCMYKISPTSYERIMEERKNKEIMNGVITTRVDDYTRPSNVHVLTTTQGIVVEK